MRVEVCGNRAPGQNNRDLPRAHGRRRKELSLGLTVASRNQGVIDRLIAVRNELNGVDTRAELHTRDTGAIRLRRAYNTPRAVVDARAHIDDRGKHGAHAAAALVVVERIAETQAVVGLSAAARQKVNRCLIGRELLAVHVDAIDLAGPVGCLHKAKFVLSAFARNHNAVATVRIGLALIEQLSVLAAIQQDPRIFNALPLLVIGIAADARQVLRIHDGLIGIVRGIQHDGFPLVEGAPHIRIFVLIEENRIGGPGLSETLCLACVCRAVPLKAAVPNRAPSEQGIAAEKEAFTGLVRHRVARDIVVNEVAINKARHAVRVIVVLRDL